METEAEHILDEIADEQGWRHGKKYNLLLSFIDEMELTDEFEEFLKEAASSDEDPDDDE